MKLLNEIEVPAEKTSLDSVIEMITGSAKEFFDRRMIMRLQLAVEEAIANIFNHSSANIAKIRCLKDNGSFIIELRDNGDPFDVIAQIGKSADTSTLKIGGYGVTLINKICDQVQYRRENNVNILKLITTIP